jgi:predicted transcriptional regulator
MPSKTVGHTLEETRDRHRRYLRAINNPMRRKILRSIKDGNQVTTSISTDTGIDEKTVGWHIRVLMDGYCIEEHGDSYALTQEGLVVDYMDR